MSERGRKGQAFILILIVLVAVAGGFALFSMHSGRVRLTPVIHEVFWQVAGQKVATANLGDEVEAHVVIEATEEYVGSIVVKIRKDISFWVDSDYSVTTFSVNLEAEQVTELELDFVPDQANAGRLRGYFVEIDFLVAHNNWVMKDSYPPRLGVREPPKAFPNL